MTGDGLTVADRDALALAGDCTYNRRVESVVEAIVAARLASVKALADEWERGLAIDDAHPMEPVSRLLADLRAVLGSDAHTEQKETGDA